MFGYSCKRPFVSVRSLTGMMAFVFVIVQVGMSYDGRTFLNAFSFWDIVQQNIKELDDSPTKLFRSSEEMNSSNVQTFAAQEIIEDEVLRKAVQVQLATASTTNIDSSVAPKNLVEIDPDLFLNSTDTSFLAQIPYQELEMFLQSHPGTPANRFVELLRKQLHGNPQWEPQRFEACRKGKNLPLCLGGFAENAPHGDVSTLINETTAHLPLLPPTDNTTVYRLRRFRDTQHVVANLGTDMACLPLFLAGASIDVRTGMVVELGPFAGFSSKCLAYGVLAAFYRAEQQQELPPNSAATMASRMTSMDTFSGIKNYRAIIRNRPWLHDVVPRFSEANTDFLDLWQLTVQYVYPQAVGRQGYIDRATLNHQGLQKDFGVSSVDVLVADSIKSHQMLHSQLEGLSVKAGTVLFFMDIQQSAKQLQQIYGCFREKYLLPVYISWRTEHMAFIVTKSFSVNRQADIFQCYLDTAAALEQKTKVMKARVKQDMAFLSGLTNQSSVHRHYDSRFARDTTNNLMDALDIKKNSKWINSMADMGHHFFSKRDTP